MEASSARADRSAQLWQSGSATPAAPADRISKFLHLCVTQHHLNEVVYWGHGPVMHCEEDLRLEGLPREGWFSRLGQFHRLQK